MVTNLIRNLPDGFEWRIEWESDEDWYDFSHLGDFYGKEPDDDFIVNRRTGDLLGPAANQERTFTKAEAFYEAEGEWEETLEGSHHTWEFVEETPEGLGKYTGYFRPVLKEDLSRGDRNSYEWWAVANHSMKDVSEDYPLSEVIKWVEQDYERHCSYGEQWIYEYLSVKLFYEDEELGWKSISGIEDDSEESYKRECEEDLMWEILDLEMLKAKELHARALLLGYKQLNAEGETLEQATDRCDAFQALIALYPLIKAERQAAYDKQRAEWEAKKSE